MSNQHTNPPSKQGYEFLFKVVTAISQQGQFPDAVAQQDRIALENLGQQGWRIVGISVNPRYSGDQLIVALERTKGDLPVK